MMTSHARQAGCRTNQRTTSTYGEMPSNDEGGNAMTATAIANGSMSEAEHQSALRRAVIASTVGTTIEWYDFLIYTTVTGLVFNKVYFPASDPWIGTLQAFGVYFVGFIARPIGALIFGHFGDRIGRKATLIVTLLMTGIATAAVGLVPGYDKVTM